MSKISELLAQIKNLQIQTRDLVEGIESGAFNSKFRGGGIEFSEVREYVPGDDVKRIDWNVSARFNEPFVKVFEEERELTVILVLDVSGSSDFGTKEITKKGLMLELAAVLAFSAVANNDKVGAIFVSDQVEKFIPAKKGRAHAFMILRDLIEYTPKSQKTNCHENSLHFW